MRTVERGATGNRGLFLRMAPHQYVIICRTHRAFIDETIRRNRYADDTNEGHGRIGQLQEDRLNIQKTVRYKWSNSVSDLVYGESKPWYSGSKRRARRLIVHGRMGARGNIPMASDALARSLPAQQPKPARILRNGEP